ncbi:hypothetical protein [Streptomyces sp. LN245]
MVHRHPVVFGAGVPLFHAAFGPAAFTLTDFRVFATGATVTTYTKQ